MSDEEVSDNEINEDYSKNISKSQNPIAEETPTIKMGKKGMRRSVEMTPERLEMLARAREKALEVRRANAEARGKGVAREQAKQKAVENKKKADEMFNKRVEEEIQKRMGTKLNEMIEEKLKDIQPKKQSKKKIIYEDTETESEAEVIKVVRKKKPVKELPPPQEPVREPVKELPEPPPIKRQNNYIPPQQYDFNAMLRQMPRARPNPYL